MKRCLSFAIIVLMLGSLMFSPLSTSAQRGATLYLAPASGSFFVGSTFSVSIFVNTGDNDINAVEVSLKFPPDKLQVVSPTAGKSFISLWVAQPEFSNIDGTLHLAGIEPSPGINTSSGLVTTVVFRVKREGEATLEFADPSKVLKNDGLGTDILNSHIGGRYALLIPPPEGPTVTSVTHPDRNTWYRDQSPVFSWTKDEGVKKFSYELDRNPSTAPDNIVEGDHTVQEYTEIADGIWYFHIRARTTSWGGTSHFPVLIDTSPPAAFVPQVLPHNLTEAQRGIASFVTTDSASGVDHYELKIESLTDSRKSTAAALFFEATSPYRLPFLEAGAYKVTVRAHDRAGNFVDVDTTFEVLAASTLARVAFGDLRKWVIGILLILAAGAVWLVKVRRKKRKERAPHDHPEAIKEVDKVFDALEEDLLEKLEELQSAKNERELTEKEKELHDKIINDLRLSEDELKHYFGNRHAKKKQQKSVKS